MATPQDFIMMPVPANAYSAVCALLGGAIMVANPAFGAQPARGSTADVAGQSEIPDVKNVGSVLPVTSNTEKSNSGETSEPVEQSTESAADGVEIDAHGHPWSADTHASTKGKTKDGLWRMKVGVSRPDPLPGFPVEEEATGTSSATDTPSATSPAATEAEDAPAATGDEDEFAAFRAAAATSEATDAAAAASVPARQLSDADLGALCNQAAVKLGDPSPVKEIIAKFTPEGQVAHSRNIPAERREEFAKEVEAKAGIEFAG